MNCLERVIQVSWRHRVLFTDNLFCSGNPLLSEVLQSCNTSAPPKTLLVLDEGLARSQPDLLEEVPRYFKAHRRTLVAPPLVIKGGERAKNSWANVATLHAAIDRHHLDLHCYLLAAGGGALLDIAGLAAATAHRGLRHVRI